MPRKKKPKVAKPAPDVIPPAGTAPPVQAPPQTLTPDPSEGEPGHRAADQDTAVEKAFVAGTLPEADRRAGAPTPPDTVADVGASLYRDRSEPARGREPTEGEANFAGMKDRAAEAVKQARGEVP